MGPLLRQALSASPLDHVDLWGSAVLRCAVCGLAAAGRWGPLGQLMEALAEPLPPGGRILGESSKNLGDSSGNLMGIF